jgi:hypothetical protein
MTQEIIFNLTDEQESIIHAGLETLTIEKILPRIWEHDHTVCRSRLKCALKFTG